MLKKTALCLSTLLLSSSTFAQILVRLDLASDNQAYNQSVVIEGNEKACRQLSDLLIEVQAIKHDRDVKMTLTIFRVSEASKALVTGSSKTLVTKREFTTPFDKAATLALEKDGQEMKLIIVAVEVE